MKKVIVTRENYEEVMFDLLENTYERDVRENILDQIHADTFLNFEWQQWSKAVYSESTEKYKSQEAEFIEGLTKEEEKKKGFVHYLRPMAVAASIVLLIGAYFLFRPAVGVSPVIVQSGEPVISKQPGEINEKKTPTRLPSQSEDHISQGNSRISLTDKRPFNPAVIEPFQPSPLTFSDTLKKTRIAVVKQPDLQGFHDTINSMIAFAKRKQSRYKVTITEENAGEIAQTEFQFEEKRYSMADVLNRKDGISLSKFLRNPNSRIVTDKETNKVVIEYIAEDHSILVLTLSN